MTAAVDYANNDVEDERDGEIYGLQGTDNGQQCEQHACCGRALGVNDLIRFKFTVLDANVGGVSVPSQAMKAVLVKERTELCTVGFLATDSVFNDDLRNKYSNKFAQVIELYDYADENFKRIMSERNLGVASFRLLEAIPSQE